MMSEVWIVRECDAGSEGDEVLFLTYDEAVEWIKDQQCRGNRATYELFRFDRPADPPRRTR